jgi:hypothetical protein
VLAAAIGISFASPAAAQIRRSDYKNQGGYHEFDDDQLLAEGTAAMGSFLRFRPPAFRVRLLRPRASFVSEMLKSVETM